MELKDFIIYKFCIGKQMTKTVFILVESEEHNILKKEKKKKEIETEKKISKKRRNHTIEWEKLDNTANLFPAIATQNMTNVYRISVLIHFVFGCEKVSFGIILKQIPSLHQRYTGKMIIHAVI